ncbi:MAG: hypothetical protein OJJ54_13580 [Pseudonocardia sp.]|nr:hypothetical protein [Pseudonocardia sp.]
MVSALADWTMVGLTIFAVAAAIVAGVFTIRTNQAQQKTLELQRDQWQRQQDMDRREQAKHVTYFFPKPTGRRVCLFNASNAQVELVTFVHVPRKPGGPWKILGGAVHVLPTTGAESADVILTEISDLSEIPRGSIVLFFTDMNGFKWRRSAEEGLRESTEQEEQLINEAFKRRQAQKDREADM